MFDLLRAALFPIFGIVAGTAVIAGLGCTLSGLTLLESWNLLVYH